MTQPGNLKCKKILHLVGYTDPVKIRKLVTQALEMCSKKSYTSISFPAIGTGEISQQDVEIITCKILTFVQKLFSVFIDFVKLNIAILACCILKIDSNKRL